MPVKGIITMCAPMTMRTTDMMYEGVLKYAREYKKFEGKSEEEIEKDIEALRAQTMPSLEDLRALIYDVRDHIDHIYAPLFVVQATHDEVIDTDSANVI